MCGSGVGRRLAGVLLLRVALGVSDENALLALQLVTTLAIRGRQPEARLLRVEGVDLAFDLFGVAGIFPNQTVGVLEVPNDVVIGFGEALLNLSDYLRGALACETTLAEKA